MDGFDVSKNGPSVSFEVENFNEAIEELKNKNINFNKMGLIETGVYHVATLGDFEGNPIIIYKRKKI